MKEIILIKNGELALKGLNRSDFEQLLIKNLKRKLAPLGEFTYRSAQSTINVIPKSDDIDLDEAVLRTSRVFGIASFSRAAACEKDLEVIKNTAAEYLRDTLAGFGTFKVESKRSDKKFPLDSLKLSAAVGERLLASCPWLSVDVHEPEITVYVEVRDEYAFIHAGVIKGAGGLPVGSSGKACLMISGGIDSPVAGWMTAKRGVELCAVHFKSPPYTSVLAERKVDRLVEKLTPWTGRIALYKIDFAHVQETIRDNCPEDLFTVISRRFMMRVADRIASDERCQALITGESIAQVASQTLAALAATDEIPSVPVLRPCIAMDKNEIVGIARRIDSFDISIEPYEDCCAIFTPKHPKTKPRLTDVRRAEATLDIDALVEQALSTVTKEIFSRF